jgi:hypothetical protein
MDPKVKPRLFYLRNQDYCFDFDVARVADSMNLRLPIR